MLKWLSRFVIGVVQCDSMTTPRFLCEVDNLGRRMFLVSFDDGATTFLFPHEAIVLRRSVRNSSGRSDSSRFKASSGWLVATQR